MAQPKGLIRKAASNNGAAIESAKRPIDRLKAILAADSVQEQFRNVLQENAGAFIASIIDLYNTDHLLQACDPKDVVMEALKAASLKLPINKQLGFAWIVPYRDGKTGRTVPRFQLGYKGYIQLCLRTGAYKYINADVVYEGELVKVDKVTGEPVIDPDKRTSDKVIGYFAYIETVNGYRKTLYMSKEEIIEHARRYSQSFGRQNSPWTTNFDEMAMKTCLRLLLSKYGIMSTDMQRALIADADPDTVAMADKQLQAGDDAIDVEATRVEEAADGDEAQSDVQAAQQSVLTES